MIPCFEVRHGDDVRGPVTLHQIKRGRAGRKIPNGSDARRVTPWGPIDLVVRLSAPRGRESKQCFEVRHGTELVGPVSLDQIRRGRESGKIPPGSDARIVWPWMPVDDLTAVTESRLPSLFDDASQDKRRWFIIFGDDEPIGPLATDKVIHALATGDLPAWAPVCAEGTKQWCQARSLPLFEKAIAHGQQVDAGATTHFSGGKVRNHIEPPAKAEEGSVTAEFVRGRRTRRR